MSAPAELQDPTPIASIAARAGVGGALMGLANLVPGISGGTMLLAVGVYPRFIRAIAEVTTLRFRARSLLVLALVGGSAALAIGLLAGALRDLVVHYRWIMYSLFIGLTFGGLPLLVRMIRPATRGAWIGGALGASGMAALGIAQASDPHALASGTGFVPLLLAGAAGASAMVLPGVSGGYLLLLLGQYLPILSAIDELRLAVSARDLAAATGPALRVVLPVGIGVGVGIATISNLLALLLRRFEKPTLGVLAGLLVGAVFGLWPFQETVLPAPEAGRPAVVERETDGVPIEDLPVRYFRPGPGQVAGSLALIALGFAATTGLSRLGRSDPHEPPPSSRAAD
jgi:putative membrane protein